MSPHTVRPMLAALLIAVVAALLPASALANVAPALTLSEPGGSAAGSTGSLGLDLGFNASAGDAVKDLSIDLPPGLLIDESTDGGLCLTVTGPTPACVIATGTATVAGTATPATLYLERAPGVDDLAGMQLIAGPMSVLGSLSLHSSLDVGVKPSTYTATHLNFSGLSSWTMSTLALTLTGVRLPSSCAADPAAMVSVWTDSALKSTPAVTRAPLTVTGCGQLAYTPSILSSVTVNPHSRRAKLVTTIVQPVGQSATERMKVSMAPGLVPSKRLAPCVQGAPCVIGTASMTSPLLPGAFASGTMTLGGSQSSPTLTIVFPAPTALVLSGTVSRTNGQLTLNNLPDIPLTSMQLRLTGTATGGPVLNAQLANCQSTQFHATLFPSSGAQAAGVNAAALYKGCPPRHHRGINRPTASVSLSGLAAGRPRLSIAVQRGVKAPPIRSVWIGLPPSLRLDSSALAEGRPSPGSGIRRERVLHGKLIVVFDHPVARGTVRLGGPLLVETRALRRRVKAGSTTPLKLIVGFVDTIGDRPTVGRLVVPR